MSARTFEEQKQIRDWLRTYLDEFGMTSLRNISSWIEERMNIKVSPTTIKNLVQKMGYSMKKGEWVKK